jgi:glycerol-3-phosphate O-acyltransferase
MTLLDRQHGPAVVVPDQEPSAPVFDGRTIVLVDGDPTADRDVVEAYVARMRAASETTADVRVAWSAAEAVRAAEEVDALITPVRVAWLPPGRDGDRRWRLRDLVALRHQVRPSRRARRRILASAPDRCRLLVGKPARLTQLERRMRDESAGDGLPTFVERQARLAVDRCERSVTGSRYKVPRHVEEELVGGRAFEDGLRDLAEALGRAPAEVSGEALEYLEEMSSTQSALARELWARLARFLYSRAYDLSFSAAAVERIRELGREHPLVFLPSHKSNLDGFVLASLLYEQGFPPNHTLGGINMAFWPLGPLGRRVGVIWIRRVFRDNQVYRWVLSRYLGYLVSKRFNLEWYVEGGRSRTGKLLPPRLGLLRYLVDAIEEAGVEDVHVVPVSITYDQLDEVAEMTRESRGAVKQPEGFRWLVRYAWRQNRCFGRVRVEFGEPVMATEVLRRHGWPAERRLSVSKLAFEVCTRINHATPVTGTGLVTLALLGVDGRFLTAREIRDVLDPLRRYAEARELPGSGDLADLATVDGTRRALAALIEHGVVQCYDEGTQPVYAIGRDNELVAAFYRNSVIHWFVNRSIAELALVRAAEEERGSAQSDVAWAEAFRLRDVLKFEFFFSDRERFEDEMREELALIDPGVLTLGEVGRALAGSGALMAHRVLTSFLDAYLVVAECVAAHDPTEPLDQAQILSECLSLGEQLRLQQRISAGEAVSTELFKSGLKLAVDRGLLDADADDLAARRLAFVEDLRDLVRRIRIVAQIDRESR